MKRLLIMAAGTGGHIFPGLAIAETMKARGWQVSWLGTAHGMERDIVPMYYQKPLIWKEHMQNARSMVKNQYSTTRMLREYEERFYKPLGVSRT